MTLSPARNACDDVVKGQPGNGPCCCGPKPSSLVLGSQTCIAFAPDGTATSTACEPGEVLWIARVHTCVCRIGCTAASACHEHVQCACVLRTTLPFLVRVLKCVQRVILWCGHNWQGKSRSCVSCVKSAVKSAVNSHTLHHLPRALRNTLALRNGNPSYQHLGYLTPPLNHANFHYLTTPPNL